LTRYLRAFSSWLGINVGDKSPVIDYNTRVELTKKRLDHSGTHNGWTLVLKKFVKLDEQTYEESWWEEVSAFKANRPLILLELRRSGRCFEPLPTPALPSHSRACRTTA
jgi:hypothetical protein